MPPEVLSVASPSRTRTPALTFGEFEFDPNIRILRKDRVEVPLPPRVLGVLELLLTRAGDVVSRQELIDTVWKEAFVTDTSLAEAVSFLRQALADDPQSPTYIQTVHRRGYRFLAPVSEVPRTAPSLSEPSVAIPRHSVRPSIANELVPWSLAILATVLAVSAIWYATSTEPVTPPLVRIALDIGPGWQLDTRAPAMALSPSGSKLAWSACNEERCQLFVRPLDQLLAHAVPDTDGAAAPFFSPDERWVGFFAGGKLKKVSLAGGGPQVVTDASQPFGAVWMPDGAIVFAASEAGGLMRVRQEGGAAEPVTTPSAAAGEIRHAFPSSVPDGDALIFTVVTSPLDGSPGRLALLRYPVGGGSWRAISESAERGVAVGREYVVFVRGREIHAVAYDRVRQAAAGAEQIVASGTSSPHIAAAASGSFVAAAAPPLVSGTGDGEKAPSWVWSSATGVSVSSTIDDLRQARLSPDGRRIAGIGVDVRPDVWMVDVERGTRTRVTFGGDTAAPVWSVAGDEILYAARGSGEYEIRARSLDASPDERRVLAVKGRHLFPHSIASSGDVAFVQTGARTRSDVGLLESGSAVGSLIVEGPFDEVAPAISPDGSMIAYQTDESGRWEVVMVRIRDRRRTTVSTGGGTAPFWSADNRTLFFERGAELLRVAVDADGLPSGRVERLLRLDGAEVAGMTPTGVVLLHRADRRASSSAVLTLQWISELRSKLGPPTAASSR